MATKYLANVTGKITEKNTLDSSAGSGSANGIPSLDTNGKLDISFMPNGLAVSTVSAPASENLTAGDFVNLWYDTAAPATLRVRKATNLSGANFKQAHGYIIATTNSGISATVYMLGSGNNQLSTLTPGTSYYLGTTGGVTSTVPSGGANIQYLGIATSATTIATVFSPVIETVA